MAINIDDTTKRKALKILEDEQTQLDGAYDKQAIKGSRGMESDFIPETAELAQRREKRIAKDSDGTYSEQEVTIDQRYYDEALVDEKETQFKEDAETLQEVCRAYDKEIIRLNNEINAKKLQIVNLSQAAVAGGCTTIHSSYVGLGTIASTFNQEVEFVKIYPKMAGPGYDPGTDNPFEPDDTVKLNESYAGFGYQNVREKQEVLVGSGAATGIRTDGSGSSIGSAFFIGNAGDGYFHGPIFSGDISDEGDCHSTGDAQQTLYGEIIALRAERDSYRNKLNIIKKNKSDKELSHWGYQNTKNEVKARKNKNASAINAIKELDGADTLQEPGLVFYIDAANNSSYYGSGITWYDISNDDYDDNGTIDGGTFIEDPVDSQRNYFRFTGGSGPNNAGSEYVSFDIDGSNINMSDTNTVTIELLSQITADSSYSLDVGGIMFGWPQYNVSFQIPLGGSTLPGLGFNLQGLEMIGISPERVDTLLLNNEVPLNDRAFDVFPAQWAHYTFVMHKYDSNSELSVKDQLLNNKIYINGVSETVVDMTGGLLDDNPNAYFGSAMDFNSGSWSAKGRIAAYRSQFYGHYFNLPMEVALCRIYNKELTQAEITANYDQVKGRFGLV